MITFPLVSILLPVYNSEKFIKKAIESIIYQTYKNWELLILYDKSSDNSLKIIEELLKNDERIRLIFNTNKGLINSLNYGIKKSKGEYIARMDSDDISLPNRIKLQIRHIIKHKLDVCGCHYFRINEKDKITDISYVPLTHKNCFIRLFSSVPFAHPSTIIRKNFLITNNLTYGINSTYAEDLDMWINSYNSGAKFGNIDKVLFKYRVLENSLSRQNKTLLRNISLSHYSSFFNKNIEDIYITINEKFEPSNEIDKYYYARLVIRYILEKYDFQTIRNLKEIKIKIIIRALTVEVKNLFIFQSIKKKIINFKY